VKLSVAAKAGGRCAGVGGSRLKGGNSKAQGNALGIEVPIPPRALKGRENWPTRRFVREWVYSDGDRTRVWWLCRPCRA